MATARQSEDRRRRPRGAALGLALFALAAAAPVAGAPATGDEFDFLPREGPRIEEPSLGDRAVMQRKRQAVEELVRRHFGTGLQRSERDLELLQRLLDERRVTRDDAWTLQALGLVLGDVMAERLHLRWVTLQDDRGSTRALRLGDSETLIFPLTMISKRIEFGEPVDVAALYARMRALVDEQRD